MQIGSKADLERRSGEIHVSRQEALQQINQFKGSLSVVAQNAREAKKALTDPRYHKIAERYRKQLVEVSECFCRHEAQQIISLQDSRERGGRRPGGAS